MSSQLELDEYYPKTLQEELNEIEEAFYELVTEDEIRVYQSFLEKIRQEKIAENAVKAVSKCPTFDLLDQDGEQVSLHNLLQKGPVVLIFYRGKW